MSSNRREYFRVDNEIYLTVERIPADDMATAESHFYNSNVRERLLNQINLGRAGWRTSLRAISNRHPEIGDYLEHLEDQMELITRYLNDQQGIPEELSKEEVNLSASGLRFNSTEHFDSGEGLKLTLVVGSCPRCIHAIGEVVRSVPNRKRGNNAVSVHFAHIQEPDRESLIQHVMEVERENIKNERL